MSVKITDNGDFDKAAAWIHGLARPARERIWREVRIVSFKAEHLVKIRMPVDTGRARASWGHSTAPASAGDGIWIEIPAELTIIQGSRVHYIQYLNEGSSRQAPAGFIDAIERQMLEELGQRIDNILG